MTLDQLLARVEEIEAKATKGPWDYTPIYDGKEVISQLADTPRPARIAFAPYYGDGKFIVAARSLLLPLVAVARAADRLPKEKNCTSEERDLYRALAALAEVRIEA